MCIRDSLDDKPGAPLRFLAEANLTQIIRREETNIDREEARSKLNAYIRELFAGPALNLIPFAAGPHDVPDDDGSGKPYLVMLGYEAAQLLGEAIRLDPLVEKIFLHKGASGDWRHNRNNLVFLLADAAGIPNTVSYTHLDVYKRQGSPRAQPSTLRCPGS